MQTQYRAIFTLHGQFDRAISFCAEGSEDALARATELLLGSASLRKCELDEIVDSAGIVVWNLEGGINPATQRNPEHPFTRSELIEIFEIARWAVNIPSRWLEVAEALDLSNDSLDYLVAKLEKFMNPEEDHA